MEPGVPAEADAGPLPGPTRHLRSKLISFASMPVPLRVLAAAALGQIVLAAALIAAQGLPLPLITVAEQEGHAVEMAAPAFAACAASLILAWTYVLAGALHAHGAARAVVVLVYLVAMYVLLLPVPPIWALLALATIGVTVGLWLRDRWVDRRAPERHHRHRLNLSTLCVCGVLTTLFFAAAAVTGQVNALLLTTSVALQLGVLTFLLTPMLLLTGADFAEWGEVLGGWAGSLVGRSSVPWLLAAATVAVAVGELAWLTATRGLVEMARGAILPAAGVLTIAALGWLAVRRGAEPRLRLWPIVTGAVLTNVLLLVIAGVAVLAGGGQHDPLPFAIGLAVPWLAVLGLAVALAVVGGRWGAPALYLAGVALVFLLSALDGVVRTLAHLEHAYFPVPPLGEGGVQVVVALGALGLVGYLALRRRLGPASAGPLRLALGLLIGLQVLALIFGVFDVAIEQSGHFSVAQALLLLCALGWDVAMSGALITNLHGRHFPRHTRVLLYLGYVMLVATAMLYYTTQHVVGTGGAPESLFESERYPQLGVLLLGIPLLGTLFVVNLGAWSRRLRPEAGAYRGADTPG
jgi:hypothetical protein